jgi:hypothetical protein
MRAGIAARLGRDPFASEGPSVEASALREGDRLRGSVILRAPDGAILGARDLSADATAGCQPLADAIVLAAALALDPERALQRSTRAPEPVPPPPVERPPSPPPPAETPPPGSAGQTPIATSLRAHGTLGLLPHAALGASAEGRWHFARHLALDAGVLWSPAVATVDGAFSVGLDAVHAGGCAGTWTDGSGTLGAGACVDGWLGALSASPRAQDVDPAGEHVWAALSTSLLATVHPTPPLLLEGGAGAYLPLTRDVLMNRLPPHDGFQQAVVAGALFVGAGVSIP